MLEQPARASAFDGLATNYDRYRIGYSSELFDALAARFDAAVSARAFHWFDADEAFAEHARVVYLRKRVQVSVAR
jgi:hypothetical protein